MRKLTTTLRLTISVLLGNTAISYEKGSGAYKSGNYESALCMWKTLAEQGNVNAKFNLGVSYPDGHGLPKNGDETLPTARLAMPISDATPPSSKGDERSRNSPSKTAA